MSKEIFSAVMGNLRTVGTKSYACVPTNLLTVDPEYQRIEGRNEKKIKKDPTALTIDKLLKKYGIKFAKTKGSRTEGYLGSYAATYKIAEKIQEEGLEYILNTLCEAGYNLIHDGLSSSLFRALAKIYLAYNIDISDYIRNMSPGILKAKARAKYSEQPSSHIALTLFLQDYIIQKYPVRKRINKKGKILKQ